MDVQDDNDNEEDVDKGTISFSNLVIVLATRGMIDVDPEPMEELLDLFDNLHISDEGTVKKVEVSLKRKRRRRRNRRHVRQRRT
jgi:hypothetical protein